MKKYKAIVFDFDGTLVDSAPGIMLTLKLMLEEMGHEPLSEDALKECVGPPIHKFFPELLGYDGDDMERALGIYRRLFDEIALPELKVYTGVIELLRDLKHAGFKTGIATCKVKHVCERQAELLKIAPYIDFISGAVPERKLFEKADILKEALKELDVEPSDALMVGDRIFDLIGANTAGTDGLGVMYGGCESREELVKHNPVTIVDDVEGLRAFLLE